MNPLSTLHLGTLAARLLLGRETLTSHASDLSATQPPAWPANCNVTYLQFNSWLSFSQYARRNAACIDGFKQCILNGPSPTGNGACDAPCLVDGPAMLQECSLSTDTPCTVRARNDAPSLPSMPPYDFEYDLCLPRNMAPGSGCWEDALPALTQYWQYDLCGPTDWNTPDCKVSVSCTFNHDMPWDPTWIIIGALGLFVGIGVGAFTWIRIQRGRMAGLGMGGTDESTYFTIQDQDEQEDRRREAEVGEPTAGPTQVAMPTRSASSMHEADADPLVPPEAAEASAGSSTKR